MSVLTTYIWSSINVEDGQNIKKKLCLFYFNNRGIDTINQDGIEARALLATRLLSQPEKSSWPLDDTSFICGINYFIKDGHFYFDLFAWRIAEWIDLIGIMMLFGLHYISLC
jgi:hypothetical protein